jgi:hypothetical protein
MECITMPLDIHTLESPDGSVFANTDRIILGQQFGVANPAGASGGASVTVAVSFPTSYQLPPNYTVMAEPNQAANTYVSNKGPNGFNVTLTPPTGITLAAGTFDVSVFA